MTNLFDVEPGHSALIAVRESFDALRDAADGWPTPNRYTEAIDTLKSEFRRMRAALEDIAAGRREFDLTPREQDFDFVSSFWFLVKLAEGVVGDE